MKNGKKIKINEYNSILGNVDIAVLHNDKVMFEINTHNRGTANICKYLRDAMAGDYVIAERPGVIVPCSKGTGDSLVDIGLGTALFNEMPKKSNETDDDESESSSCTLTFLIPSNILSSGVPIAGFRLYSKNSKILYAEVDLTKNGVDPIEVTPGTNLKVT